MSNLTSKALWVALGVLSLISGVAIIGMPLALASLYGLPRWRWVLRIIGVRDVIIGTGLLISSEWPWFMWAVSSPSPHSNSLSDVESSSFPASWLGTR